MNLQGSIHGNIQAQGKQPKYQLMNGQNLVYPFNGTLFSRVRK